MWSEGPGRVKIQFHFQNIKLEGDILLYLFRYYGALKRPGYNCCCCSWSGNKKLSGDHCQVTSLLDKEGEGRSLFLKEGEDPVPGGSPLSPIINIPFSTRSLADGRTTD